jgi:glycosyltransferase involved in cell wall biosynthesis
MRILQLCLKPPLPALDGGCIAMNNITQGLLESGKNQVKILTIFTSKHDFNPDEMPIDYLKATDIEGVFVDTNVNWVDAFANFITSDSYNISRFFSTDFDVRLMRLLKKEYFDIIHLESLFMTPYLHTIKRYSKAPVVMRAHNVEYIIWEKIAKGQHGFFKRIYLQYLSRKLRQYEISVMNQCSGIATISDEDRLRFLDMGIQKPMRTIPFGIRMSDYETNISEKPEMALFHLGAMDWNPNIEGIRWFLDEVWPLVNRAHPSLKLYLAGRNMTEEIRNLTLPNVEVIGEVDDAQQFMQSKTVMIVPLLSGGGIRVKIIEGLAMGKTIISTSIGAEGIRVTHNNNILIADRPLEWLECINRIMNEPGIVQSIGEEARNCATGYENHIIIRQLLAFYKELRK